MTLQDAFRELVTKRAWYKNSGILQQNAIRDKRFFLEGRAIPEERIRRYLRTAGWEQVQQEQWTKGDSLKKDGGA